MLTGWRGAAAVVGSPLFLCAITDVVATVAKCLVESEIVLLELAMGQVQAVVA